MSYPTTSSASDVWSLRDVYKAEAGDEWPTTDAPFDAVALLINADGLANGSTDFDDASNNNLSLTVNDTAQVNTTTKKYGTGSIYLPTQASAVIVPSSSELVFGTDDFCVEAWVYPQVGGDGQNVFFGNLTNSAAGQVSFSRSSGGVIRFTGYSAIHIAGSTVVSNNSWTHVAVSREGTTMRLFIDGTLDATASNSTDFDKQNSFYVGRFGSGFTTGDFVGYIDDLRVTTGFARYTANFTPPTEALPTS